MLYFSIKVGFHPPPLPLLPNEVSISILGAPLSPIYNIISVLLCEVTLYVGQV